MNPNLKGELTSYTPDELRELYKKDPQLFDDLAGKALSKACLGRTPEQTQRFRQMQWTIDAQLRKARTPAARMQVMENIFYSKVFGSGGELSRLMDSCTDLIRAVKGDSVAQAPEPERMVVNQAPRSSESAPRRPNLYLVKK
jgi:hypothetical protein